ncbi:beta-ketoacyl synthase chain length factor [Alistipes onderdonkii]|uniref:beta-ketoacyl synthase chain length factor n=1 Tax=Alistipes onderdonkii TaxID=328813 RepID=UPI0036F35A59
MKLYVNCITSGAGLRRDIKELIPEMNLRRRMSRVVKSGVAAGIESLLEFGDRAAVEAVVTATGLGCIADSEKFLDSLIANEERMLNPTPFIQSTFNTVGAQIALLRGLHCYNTTYANRWTSFENALTDAALRIGAGLSRAVLVGAFDETTPSAGIILQRLGVAQQGGWGESSVFFVLTAEAFDTSVAAITGIRFPDGTAIGESAGTGRIHSREDAGTRTSAGDNAGREIPAGGSPGTGAAAGNGEEPGNTPQSGERRTIRASMSGVTPHFTAIAEVFRRVVAGEAGNTGKAGNIGNAGSIEDTGNIGNAGNAGQRIVLYNDFPGSTVSAIELTCM